ncbi:LysM peptidoglycan-binding domain-containing protein [Fibrobacterota bacterium]
MLGQAGTASQAGPAGSASAAKSAKAKGPKKVKAFPVEEPTGSTESHYIECEFTDSAGNLLAGVHYVITGPDKKEIIGVSGPEGRARHDGYPKKGSYKVGIQELANAKWNKAKAAVGDEMEFTVDADGYEDGEEADVSIVENIGKTYKTVETKKVKIQNKKIKGKWKSTYQKSKGDEPGTRGKTGYYLYISKDTKTAVSPRLELSDKLDLKVQDDKGQPLKDMEYEIKAPDGEVRKGKLNSKGEIKEDDLAPGEAQFRFTGIKAPDTLDITIEDENGNPVADTGFQLELKQGASKKIKTDSWGKAKWDKPPKGTYDIKISQTVTKQSSQQVHVVKKGDTLSEICQQYYGDMMLYPEVAEFNDIKNPDLIYPDDKIKLPSILYSLEDSNHIKSKLNIRLPKHELCVKPGLCIQYVMPSRAPLKSVKCILYKGTKRVEECITDNDGKAKFDVAESGEYYLECCSSTPPQKVRIYHQVGKRNSPWIIFPER